jgi:F1F0 ATPase subunit 2
LLGGGILGALYFGGLWWTVRLMPDARHPLRLYFGSLMARLAIVLVGFWYLLVGSGWQQLVACLIGFVGARVVLVRRLGRVDPAPSSAAATERTA